MTFNQKRIEITTSCRDCDDIPKVSNAGEVIQEQDVSYQVMHNGVKVELGGYYGEFITEIVRRLKGHHEPQEEKAFHQILQYIPENATMIELGAFWGYYSLWFQKIIRGAKNYLVEPCLSNLELGRRNFELNRASGIFIEGAVGRESCIIPDFFCSDEGTKREVQCWSVDDIVAQYQISNIDLLHADIQGAELDMLYGCEECIHQKKIRFIFISTHHHLFSNDPIIHQRCLEFLQTHGAHILVAHTVGESFSGDGLIVASFWHTDDTIPSISVSYNRYSNNIFRELEYDLADAKQEAAALKRQQENIDKIKARVEDLEWEKVRLVDENRQLRSAITAHETYANKSILEKILIRLRVKTGL